MDLGIAGKTVIVTGGSSNIGRGCVLAYAAEGSNVVIASRDPVQGGQVANDANELGGGRVVFKQTDVTRIDSVQQLRDYAMEEFGRIDILVNNAGGVAHSNPFLEKPEDQIEWEIDLNIRGVINCCRVIGGVLVQQGHGSVINITSNSALHPQAAHYVAHYGATKGYVNTLTKALAYEWAGTGVRINNVAPGWIVPHSTEHAGEGSFWNRFGYSVYGKPDEMEAQVQTGTLPNIADLPIKRLGRPEDIANLAMFLSSDRASYITGQLVSVSGGAWMP